MEIVSANEEAICEEYTLNQELRVYKDPALFLEVVSGVVRDPKLGWRRLLQENPLLVSLTGQTFLMKLGPARPFKGFNELASLYEMADPKMAAQRGMKPKKVRVPMAIPIRVCGMGGPYAETLGFVLELDLYEAQMDRKVAGKRPPSTPGNPILPLPEAPSHPTYLP